MYKEVLSRFVTFFSQVFFSVERYIFVNIVCVLHDAASCFLNRFSRVESYVASACVDCIVTARVSENHVRILMFFARWCVDYKKSFLKDQPLDEVYKCFTLFYLKLCENL